MNYLQLLRRYPAYLAFGGIHFLFSSLGQTFLIGLFKGYWVEALAMSDQLFGNAYALATLASAFTLPWLGNLVDRYPLRRLSLANGGLLALCCAGATLANSVFMLAPVLYGLRLSGQGVMVLLGSTSIARYFSHIRGKALSIASLGLTIGEGIFPPILAWLIARSDWQNGWYFLMALVGLVFLPLTVGLVRLSDTFQRAPLARNEGREQTSTSATPDTAGQKSYTRREVLRDGVFYAVLPLALFTPFVFTGLIIHQNLLLEAKQWSTSLFAAAFLGFGLTRFGANILVGILVDRFSARRVFVFSQLPFGFGLMVLAVFEPGWAAWVFLGLAGVSASAGALTTGALWAELYGGAYLGSIKSMAATAMVLSTAAASSLLVYFMQSPERLETMLWITAGLSAVLSAIAGRALTQRFLRPKHEAPVSRIG